MAGLRECMKFASRMSDAEQNELVDRVDAYIASGIAPAEAQRAATNDMLAELEQERQEIVALAEEQNAPVKASRAEIQAQAKALGLPATGPSSQIERLINIVESSPTEWTREDFDLIAPHLSVHQDLRPGAEDRISAILSDGLRAGMVDSVGNMLRGDVWTWSRGLKGVPAYVFISGALKYKPGGNPRLAPGNKPLFAVTPAKGQEFFDALKTAVRPVDAADEVQFSQSTSSRPPQAGPGFYSALRKAVADAKTNASPAEYWSNLIKGKVSQEDLQASGLSTWLTEQEGKIKKADVLAWVGENTPEGATDDVALSQTETPEFKRWSHGHQVLTMEQAHDHLFLSGEPVVVESLHGSSHDNIRVFATTPETGAGTTTRARTARMGAFFTEEPNSAEMFTEMGDGGAPTVYKVFLRFDKPFNPETVTADELVALERVFPGITDDIAEVNQRNPITDSERSFNRDKRKKIEEFDYFSSNEDVSASKKWWARAEELRSQGFTVNAKKFERGIGSGIYRLEYYPAKFNDEPTRDFFSVFSNISGRPNARALLEELGYDGVIVRTEVDAPRFKDNYVPTAEWLNEKNFYFDRIHQFVVFKPTQVKSATGNSGAFDPNNPDISLSQSTNQQPLSAPGQTWTGPGLSKLDDFIYSWQNKTVDLKRVVEAIKDSGSRLTDRSDGELRETLYTGRVSAKIDRFENDELLPLLQTMRLAGVSLEDLGKYLHARHAQERNAEMRARNRNRQGNNDALSGMSDADAAAILAAAPPAMRSLAARVDAMITGTRNLMEISGIETPQMVDALRQSYQHYVPLHREESDTDSSAHPIGQGFNVKGHVPKRALGSEKAVAHADILSHIISEREQVIIRAEKNLVAQAVYAMALQNPNPDFWTTDTPPQVGYIDERASIYVPGQGLMPNPNQGQVVYRADPNYKNRENVLTVKVNGVDRTVTFEKSDPRAVRMAQALKNLDVEQLGNVTQSAAKVTRFLAAVNTQYNPVFTIKNFVRDLSAGLINLSSTELAGSQATVAAGIGPAMRAIYRTERGKSATSQQWAALYDEFKLRGAKTGFRDVFLNEAERTKDLIKKTDRLSGKMAPLQQTLDLLSDANDAIENAIRLSAYKAALDKGMSKDKAASLAKNLTVNFNRKGAKTAEFNAWYMFFNAAIQGSARLAQTMKGPAAAKIIGAGLGLGVLQALAMLSMDDDEREAVPEFVKRTSLVIPHALFGIKGGQVTAIPLPLGLHVIPNTSRSLTELVLRLHKGDKVDIPSSLAATFGAALDAFNPLGGASFLQQLAPSVFDPVVQLANNEGGLGGNPIYRERGQGNEGMPGYLMGRDSTSPVYKWLAKVIHLAGNDLNPDVRNTDRTPILSPQPEAIRLIPETIFGGVWRETEKLLDTAIGLTKDVPLDMSRVPLLSAFYGDYGADLSVQGTFWKNINKLEARQLEGRNAKKNDREVSDSWMDKILREKVQGYREKISELTAKRREMTTEGGQDVEIREIEKQMGEIMREFNAEVRDAQRGSK